MAVPTTMDVVYITPNQVIGCHKQHLRNIPKGDWRDIWPVIWAYLSAHTILKCSNTSGPLPVE